MIDRRSIQLGIVCPVANEAPTICQFVKDVLAECQGFQSVHFFAILDKVSKDNTLDLLKDLANAQKGLTVIWAPENTCIVDAYTRGYREALEAGCEWILEINAGGRHRPQEMSRFFEDMAKGYDCVFGSRFCEGGKLMGSTPARTFLSWGGTHVANFFLGTKLSDMTSGFELFSRAALQHILEKGIQSKGHFLQTEMKFHCRKMNVLEVPIHYTLKGKSVNAGTVWDSFKNLWRLKSLQT